MMAHSRAKIEAACAFELVGVLEAGILVNPDSVLAASQCPLASVQSERAIHGQEYGST